MLHHKSSLEGRMSKVQRDSSNHPKLLQKNKIHMKRPQVKKHNKRIWGR